MSDFEKSLVKVLTEQVVGFKKLLNVNRLTSGASRLTFELLIKTSGENQKVALRLNPTDGNTDGLMSQRISPHAEATVMRIARSNGIPTPKINYILNEDDNLGEGYLMEWMYGESVGSRIVKNPKFNTIRPTLAKQCGRILSKIHSINVSSTGLEDVLKEMSPRNFVSNQYQIYEALQIKRPMIDYVAQWLLANLPKTRPPSLVHNDFRNGNLLVEEEKGITGVLDWEIAHIGNPVRDIGWLCTKSWCFGAPDREVGGFGAIDDLLDAYRNSGGLDIETSEIRFWKVFGSFWWAVACMLMQESYENGSDRSLERPAIGRRVSECEVDCANLLMSGEINHGAVLKKRVLDRRKDDLLLSSVKEFLEKDIVEKSIGRTKFLAKIASQSLGIAMREKSFLTEFERNEKKRLENLLGERGELPDLRSKIISAIKEHKISLRNESLKAHLRQTAFSQILIDQPNYPSTDELLHTTS